MNRTGRIALFAATASFLFADATLAARLPDWATAISENPPEIGSEIKEHDSRILLTETAVSVEPDGTLRIRQNTAAQAVTGGEDSFAEAFHFTDGMKIVKSKAWHLPPEGRTKKNKDGALDLKLDDSFVSDQKTRLVQLSDIEKGSLVFFEFEALEVREQLGFQFLFYTSSPTDVMRFSLEAPPGWTVRHSWLRREGPEPNVSGNSWVWEARDLGPGDDDPLGPSPAEGAPLLILSFSPPQGVAVGPAAFESWIDLASWYEDLVRDREAATPEITATATGILESLGSDDPFERVKALADHVRDKVRYVAKEIGIGGYQPRHAAQVHKNLYGDCKDKGTLFRSLLAADGIESYPILINLSRHETVSEEIPNLQAFNHFVVGVAVSGEVPPAFAPAMVQAGELGALLVVDTTNEFITPGYLSASLSGKTGLVVAGESSALVRLPADDPSAHRVETRYDAEIHSDYSVTMRFEIVRYGAQALWARYTYAQSAKDYREAIDDEVRERWPGASVQDFSVIEETDDGGFNETIDLRIEPPHDVETAELLRLFPGALNALPRVKLGRRNTPVQYQHAMQLHYVSTVRGAADDTALPTPKEAEGEGWSTVSHFSREDSVIHGEWEFVLTRLEYAPEDFRDLRKLWSEVRKGVSAAVSLGGPLE